LTEDDVTSKNPDESTPDETITQVPTPEEPEPDEPDPDENTPLPMLDYRRLAFERIVLPGDDQPSYQGLYELSPGHDDSPVFSLTVSPQEPQTPELQNELLRMLSELRVAFALVAVPREKSPTATERREVTEPRVTEEDPDETDADYVFSMGVEDTGSFAAARLTPIGSCVDITVYAGRKHVWKSKSDEPVEFWVDLDSGRVVLRPPRAGSTVSASSGKKKTRETRRATVTGNAEVSKYDASGVFRGYR
jgi:hypothetical protein